MLKTKPNDFAFLVMVFMYRDDKLKPQDWAMLKANVQVLVHRLEDVGRARLIKYPNVSDFDTQGIWQNGKQQGVMWVIRAKDAATSSTIVNGIKKLNREAGLSYFPIVSVPTYGTF